MYSFFLSLWKWLSTWLQCFFYPPLPVVDLKNKVIHPLTLFVNRQRERWDTGAGNSLQVDSCFYNKEVYEGLTLKELQTLGKRWRCRAMMVPSPLPGQTNILMYYDAEKLGFAYHSDFSISSPDLLNALAMKYCIDFGCRDFFVDETVWKSPCLPLHAFVETSPKKQEAGSEDEAFRKKLKEKSKLFVPKREALPVQNRMRDALSLPKTTTRKSMDPLTVTNRFIYKNKVSDYSFLQPPEKIVQEKREHVKELVFGIKPSLDCLFEDVMTQPIENMFDKATVETSSDYKAYKRRQQQANSCE